MSYAAGTTDPTGWFLCDGRAVSRTTYAALFAVISTVYGAGDGSTTFNLPDLRSRFPMGADNAGTAAGAAGRTSTQGNNTLAATGSGEDVHALAVGELASHSHSHTHSVPDPGHNHNYPQGGHSAPNNNSEFSNGDGNLIQSLNSSTNSTGITSTASDATATRSGTGHNNRPLQQVVNFIIKT